MIEREKIEFMNMDLYKILGVADKNASIDQIKIAYRKLACKLHPDKNLDKLRAHTNFILLQKVYKILSNESFRNVYDAYTSLFELESNLEKEIELAVIALQGRKKDRDKWIQKIDEWLQVLIEWIKENVNKGTSELKKIIQELDKQNLNHHQERQEWDIKRSRWSEEGLEETGSKTKPQETEPDAGNEETHKENSYEYGGNKKKYEEKGKNYEHDEKYEEKGKNYEQDEENEKRKLESELKVLRLKIKICRGEMNKIRIKNSDSQSKNIKIKRDMDKLMENIQKCQPDPDPNTLVHENADKQKTIHRLEKRIAEYDEEEHKWFCELIASLGDLKQRLAERRKNTHEWNNGDSEFGLKVQFSIKFEMLAL